MRRDSVRNDEIGFSCVLKGAVAALVFAIVSAIIFAAILTAIGGSDTVIYPINQTLKALAVAIASVFFVRGEKGWLKGGGIGLLFSAFAYPIFSALCGDFSIGAWVFLELFIAFLVGALGGILAVNLRRG